MSEARRYHQVRNSLIAASLVFGVAAACSGDDSSSNSNDGNAAGTTGDDGSAPGVDGSNADGGPGSGGNTGMPGGGATSTGGQTVAPGFAQQRKEPGCDGPQEYVSPDGKSCYMIDQQELPWAEAQALCKAWGGDLAAFEIEGESNAVSSNFGPSAWTGGHYDGTQWSWPDGTVITTFLWDTTPALKRNDGECLEVKFNELWDDLPCTEERHPLCEKAFDAGPQGGGGAPSTGGGTGTAGSTNAGGEGGSTP